MVKRASQIWQVMSKEEKEPYEKAYAEKSELYQKYMAMKRKWDERLNPPIKKISQKDEPESPDTKTPDTKKRGRKPKEVTDSPQEPKPERAAKKPRSVKEAPKDILPEDIIV